MYGARLSGDALGDGVQCGVLVQGHSSSWCAG